MIQQLINRIIETMRTDFASDFATGDNPNAAESKIGLAPPVAPFSDDSFPCIAVQVGDLDISKKIMDNSSSQARPQGLQEMINIITNTSNYSVAKAPLRNSVRCQLTNANGQITSLSEGPEIIVVDGNEVPISIGTEKDFRINYSTQEIRFSVDLTDWTSIQLQYSFAGVFSIREFQQEFFTTVYEEDITELERWASLSLAVVLTNNDELLQYFNTTTPSTYTSNVYSSMQTLQAIQLLKGSINHSSDTNTIPHHYQWTFIVRGTIKTTKDITGASLIQKINIDIKKDAPFPAEINSEIS